MTVSQIKVRLPSKFPSSVDVESPLTLDRSGGTFDFGLDVDALTETFDLLYEPLGKPPILADSCAGADIGAKINTAIAGLGSAGGSVVLAGGPYLSIATAIVSTGGPIDLDLNGASLRFLIGVPGVRFTGDATAFSRIRNGELRGSDTVAATNSGLTIESPFFRAENLQVLGFGRDSIAVLSGAASSTGTANADNWRLDSVLVRKSVRDSVHVAGADSNKGVALNLEMQCFGRYGLYDIASFGNTYSSPIFDGFSLAGSSTTAAYVSSESTVLEQVYCERSTDTIELAGACIKISTFGGAVMPTIIQSGGAAFTQQIERFDALGYPASYQLNVMQPPSGLVPYTAGFRVNATTGNFEIMDRSSTGLYIAAYDPVALRWTMNGAFQVLGDTHFNDAKFFLDNNSDPTKRARFSTAAITAGATRVFSLPDASTTLLTTDVTQTVSSKTIDNTNTIIVKGAFLTLQDASDTTKQARFALSGIATGNLRSYALPDGSTTLVGIDVTQTLTNKSISGAANTLSNIANASLTNSSITINGSSVALGASVTVTAAASSVAVGTTTVSGGTTTRVLYDNAGVIGEYSVSGSGNVAMTTNGIFVTPNLGTPSAIVLTNGTGLPISTGLTGAGTGVLAALAINVGSAGAFTTFNGAHGTPSSITLTSATGLPLSTGVTGAGTGVLAALAVNVGSAGAFVTFNGALGTPSSGVATNLTGTAASLTAGTASAVAVGGITGLGTGVATALAVNVGTAGSPVVNGGALGTPSSGVATNLTGTASGLTSGDVANAAVIAKVLTAYAAAAGTVASTDSILQALQKLGGLVDNAAWTSYTPTISALSGGAPSSVTGIAGAYKLIGKTCHFRVTFTITTNGAAATAISATLPFTAHADAEYSAGNKTTSSGLHAYTNITFDATLVVIFTVTATYPGISGSSYTVSGEFETN